MSNESEGFFEGKLYMCMCMYVDSEENKMNENCIRERCRRVDKELRHADKTIPGTNEWR